MKLTPKKTVKSIIRPVMKAIQDLETVASEQTAQANTLGDQVMQLQEKRVVALDEAEAALKFKAKLEELVQ